MPPLYITLAFAGMLAVMGYMNTNYTISGVISQIFFYQNYSDVLNVGSGLPLPLWSLAVEEHFYLAFPLLFSLFYARTTPGGFALWCAIACIVSLAFRLGIAIVTPDAMGMSNTMSHTRMDSILFGCILAVWNNPAIDRDAWKPNFWHVAGAVGILLFCFLYRDDCFRVTFRYTLQGIALFVLFSFILQAKGMVYYLLSCAPARIIGLYSYTIYLVHFVFIFAIGTTFPFFSVPIQIFWVLVATFVYSWLMYTFIERPAAKLRKKLHQGVGIFKVAKI